MKLLAEWAPMLLLVGVWVFFMLQLMGKKGPSALGLAELRRHNDVLEKLLSQHDARLRELEDSRRGS
jgi:hypothetical protein